MQDLFKLHGRLAGFQITEEANADTCREGDISLSEVTKMEDDDTIFHAQMNFSYSIQYKWTQETKNEVLRGIATKILGLD